ncbi:hypothetical protein FB45DRAFT_905875 [Roridomyces roridus]|uniref:Uncharacterized protein n=1 Tax=Roridomyces roridus TaxID=1738132 RepID=A0AAD7FVP6_9AGAR|nr:hypothetical protein FB45DRAFT_905875 [Roridomyces roridus]
MRPHMTRAMVARTNVLPLTMVVVGISALVTGISSSMKVNISSLSYVATARAMGEVAAICWRIWARMTWSSTNATGISEA